MLLYLDRPPPLLLLLLCLNAEWSLLPPLKSAKFWYVKWPTSNCDTGLLSSRHKATGTATADDEKTAMFVWCNGGACAHKSSEPSGWNRLLVSRTMPPTITLTFSRREACRTGTCTLMRVPCTPTVGRTLMVAGIAAPGQAEPPAEGDVIIDFWSIAGQFVVESRPIDLCEFLHFISTCMFSVYFIW